MGNTVVLTGYAGFIGSQIARDLLDKGYTVIGVDNFSEGSDRANYSDIESDKFYPLGIDMNDPRLENVLKDMLQKGSIAEGLLYIINCGAQSHVDRSFEQVSTFIDSNIKGPLNLAKIALDIGVEKFVQVSTDEVFAESPQPFDECSWITPQNAYSSSKASAEMFLLNYQKAFGLPLVITNGANTYGKRQLAEKIIPLSIKRVLDGEKIPLYKTPAQRMWMHVEDHSSGIIASMERGVIGERYCFAPEEENELYTHDLVGRICEELGTPYYDSVSFVDDRVNYDLRYFMLNGKAKEELGWYPSKKIVEDLPSIVRWFKDKFEEEKK